MNRHIRAALALACVLPLLGACNLTASRAEIEAALNPTGAAVKQADALKQAASFLANVRAYTAAACKVEPSMSAVAKIAEALAPETEAVLVPVTAIGDAFCQPGLRTAAAALEPKKPERAEEPKPGQPVSKLILVNGKLVQVDGTKVK